jgi:hypothetical protein
MADRHVSDLPKKDALSAQDLLLVSTTDANNALVSNKIYFNDFFLSLTSDAGFTDSSGNPLGAFLTQGSQQTVFGEKTFEDQKYLKIAHKTHVPADVVPHLPPLQGGQVYDIWEYIQLAAPPDNLGDHTATEPLKMGDFCIVKDGAGSEGIKFGSAGQVGMGFDHNLDWDPSLEYPFTVKGDKVKTGPGVFKNYLVGFVQEGTSKSVLHLDAPLAQSAQNFIGGYVGDAQQKFAITTDGNATFKGQLNVTKGVSFADGKFTISQGGTLNAIATNASFGDTTFASGKTVAANAAFTFNAATVHTTNAPATFRAAASFSGALNASGISSFGNSAIFNSKMYFDPDKCYLPGTSTNVEFGKDIGLDTPIAQGDKDGDMLLYEGNLSRKVRPEPWLKKAYIGRNTPETLFLQDSYITFEKIDATFSRFSHQGTRDHASLSEEGGWGLNSAGELSQTVNSLRHIGFASQNSYSGYEASVVLKVGAADAPLTADNDVISFVLCLARVGGGDPDNMEHTLSVVRTGAKVTSGAREVSLHGAAYRWGIVYNLGKTTEMWLKSSETNVFDRTWASLAGNGDAVRISRTPTSITVKLAQDVATVPSDNSTAWGNEMTVDLTVTNNALSGRGDYATAGPSSLSVADLQKFRDPCKWGLGARSQPYSSYGDLFFAAADEPFVGREVDGLVFNVETGQTWQIDQTVSPPQWNLTTAIELGDYVQNGQAAFDLGSKTLFYKQQDILQPLLSARPEFEERSSDFTVVAGMLGKVILMSAGVSTVAVGENLGQGFYCKFLNHAGTITISGVGKINQGADTLNVGVNQHFELIGNGLDNGSGVTVVKSMP